MFTDDDNDNIEHDLEDEAMNSPSLWDQTDQQTKSLLASVLEDKDPVFRAKVLDLVVKHGLSADDPLFLMLIATSSLEVMLSEAPSALKLSLDEAKKEQGKMAKTALETTSALIAESVRDLIGKTEALQLTRPSKILIPGLSLFAIVFSLGWLTGIASNIAWGQLFSSGQRIMSLEESATLAQAKSQNGQFARNLWEWNQSYLESGNCLKDMSQLGVKLSFGTRQAVSGFCALWVVPPNQRQYQ